MAVDLTTGSYDEAGVFSKYNEKVSKPHEKSKYEGMCSLKGFRVHRVLKECSHTKSVVVEGRFSEDEKPAIIIVEKMPFDVRVLPQLLSSNTRLELKFRNNIYANYHVYPQSGFNGFGIQVIHPASEDDFLKFIDQPLVMIKETKEIYESVVYQHLQNIFHQKQENMSTTKNHDNTLHSDTSEGSSFILLKDDPDKCSCATLHVRAKAVVLQSEMLSLRDLTASSIPLLIKIQKKCLEELSIKYKIPASKIESYVTYPPSSFPLHIFFESIEKDIMIPVEKAHHLESIITNLRLIPDYYQKATLTYSVTEKDPLVKKINEYKTSLNVTHTSCS